MNEVKNGMPLPYNLMTVVEYAVGSKKNAMEIFLQGKLMNAKEAMEWGVLDAIVDDPMEAAIEKITFTVEQLKAYAQIKHLLKKETKERMRQNKEATRNELIQYYNFPSKL